MYVHCKAVLSSIYLNKKINITISFTFRMFKHHSGRCDVVGCANVMVNFRQFLRDVAQIVLSQSECRLWLASQTFHDLEVVVQVGQALLVTLHLVPQVDQLVLHVGHWVVGDMIFDTELLQILFDKLELVDTLLLPLSVFFQWGVHIADFSGVDFE